MSLNEIKKILIYGLIDPETYELRYIGRSSSGFRRPRSHFQPVWLKREDYVHRWIKSLIKINKKPKIVVLETWSGLGERNSWLNEREKCWIRTAKEFGYKLTNLTEGGEGTTGLKQSEESIKKRISKIKGKKRTQEQITAMSRRMKNVWKNNPELFKNGKFFKKGNIPGHRKKVICLNEKKIYNSIKEAALDHKISSSTILNVCKGNIISAANHIFRYIINNEIVKLKKNLNDKNYKKKIVCINDNRIFKNGAVASAFYGFGKHYAAKIARGERVSKFGLKFKFIDRFNIEE